MGDQVESFLSRGLGFNLCEIQGSLALQLVGYVMFTVLSMIVSSISAWILLIHQFWHWTKFYFVARSIESDNWQAVSFLVSYCSVLHTLVFSICKNLFNKTSEKHWLNIVILKRTSQIFKFQVSYFYGVTNIDHKCIWNRLNGHPCVALKNLKSYWAILYLLQHCKGTSIWMWAKT